MFQVSGFERPKERWRGCDPRALLLADGTLSSQVFVQDPDGRVPLHSGEVVGRGLLRAIVTDTKLSGGDLVKLLQAADCGDRPVFRLAPPPTQQ
jgi:hypothetical protein